MDWQTILETVIKAGIRVVIALGVCFVTFKLIDFLIRKLEDKLHKKAVDKTISNTLVYAGRIGLKALVVLALVSFVGIDTSGITALIASLGVGIGLAVNGTLSNFAGGVLLIMTRPFKIDDYIESEGVSGTVEDIRITFTRLRTPDNKVVYIPNGKLSADTIINYSEKPTRRLDLTFGVAYGSDLALAMKLIGECIAQNPLALADPEPNIKISDYKDSAVELIARPWVKSDDYWQLKFELLESVGKAFRENGIEIPFNQLDVHVING